MLVDTSVWIDHFRKGNTALVSALEKAEVWCHPFVQGELACGNLQNRDEILSLLDSLAQAPMAGQAEVLAFVERHKLMGTGLGWIDVHLLGSSLLANIPLWTLDRTLSAAAKVLGIRAL